MKWMALLAVGFGSMAGGMARYALMTGIDRAADACRFPWGTLVVNVVGCVLMGFLMGLSARSDMLSPQVRLCLATGFCGGFTTFSTFVNDGAGLWTSGFSLLTVVYVAVSLLLGGLALWCGGLLGRSLL